MRLFARNTVDRELREEMEQHIAERAEYLVSQGMSPADAMQAARRAFGNPTTLREHARNVWRFQTLEEFASDVKFTVRQLRRAKGFTIAAVLTLAIGIGANTALFSVVNAVLWRPLPFADPARLVTISPSGERGSLGPGSESYPNFFDVRRENTVFERIASHRPAEFALTALRVPVRVRGEVVSWDLFQTLGVRPSPGRAFASDEEAPGARAVILSHQLWQRELGGDSAVVGRSLEVDRTAYRIVGIAPKEFNFPAGGEQVQLWTTLAADARPGSDQPVTEQRAARLVSMIGRLKPGVTLARAQASMDALAASLAERFPAANKGTPAVHFESALQDVVGGSRRAVWALFGAMWVVLLLVCANIATLLLSRTSERAHEFALRAAIGAGHGRIRRQVIAESVTLSAVGAAAGVLTAQLLLGVLLPLASGAIPRIEQTTIDATVLAFSVVVALAVSLVLGVVPVMRLGSMQYADPLKHGARGHVGGADRARGLLVACQIALGLMLVNAAGLFGSSFLQIIRRDLGFAPERLLTFTVGLPASEYGPERRGVFYRQLLDNLRALPDVNAAGTSLPLPLAGSRLPMAFEIDGTPTPPHAEPSADMAIVSPSYFAAIGLPFMRGRAFTAFDDAHAPPVVIVNRAFANTFFPGQNPIGKRIKPGATPPGGGSSMREIVGVVANARQTTVGDAPEPVYYLAQAQMDWCCPSVIVRASGSPERLTPAIIRTVSAMDPALPVSNVRTAAQIVAASAARPRFQTWLLSGFAAIGLILISVGLYGVLTGMVVRRTREIGLRVALGAAHHRIVWMIMRQAGGVVALGILVGVAGAFASVRLLRATLQDVAAPDPLLVFSSAALIAIVAGLSALIPAHRASSIDPMTALREE